MLILPIPPAPICKQGLLGLIGGTIVLGLSACGSSPSSTLTSEASRDSEAVALLGQDSYSRESFDAERFLRQWDQLSESDRSSLSRADRAAFGNTLAFSFLFSVETLELSGQLTVNYSVSLGELLLGSITPEEIPTLVELTADLKTSSDELGAQIALTQERLANLETPNDPSLAQNLADLQATLLETQSSNAQIQTNIVDVVDEIVADEIVTNQERVTLGGVAANSLTIGGQLLAQSGTYVTLYSDQVSFCLGLDTLLSRLCSLLPSPNPTPTPSPAGSPSPSPSPIGSPFPSPTP